MPTKFTGPLNLTRINEHRNLIVKNRKGDSTIWIDVVPRKQPDQYGNTHSVVIYDSEKRENIYLADLRPRDFGTGAPQAAAAPPKQDYRRSNPIPPEASPSSAAEQVSADDDLDLPF